MDENNKGIHCIISGKVQGVFYRASTQKMAQNLTLTGWVSNIPNGNVELKAFGDNEKLQDLINWLWDGPSGAVVKDIEVNYIELERFNGFVIKYN